MARSARQNGKTPLGCRKSRNGQIYHDEVCIQRHRATVARRLRAYLFFHGRGVALQRTKLGFLRSILHQVLRCLMDSLPIFLQFYEEKSTTTKETEIQWTEAELERILTHIVRELDENVRIFLLVDALDESGEETAQNIVNLLRRMTTSTKVKSIFSCRRYPILQTCCKLISMEKGNEADIQTVVRSLLGKEFENCGDASSLEESILRRANGMFQWAILVTRSIIDKHRQLGNSIFALQKIIEELPLDLHKLYASLLQAIQKDEKHQTVKLLRWILFSIRPLTAEELQHALVADEDMPGSIHDFHNSPNFVDPEKGTTTFSKGLAEVREHDGVKIAQFIHQSVSDYLLTEGGLGELIKSTSRISVVGESHLLISRSCVRYALLPEMSVPPLIPYRERRERLSAFEKRFPLAKYVHNYWILHTMHVESTGINQKDLLEYFKDNEHKICKSHLLMLPTHDTFDTPWFLDIDDIFDDDDARFTNTWGCDKKDQENECRKYPLGLERSWNPWEDNFHPFRKALIDAWEDLETFPDLLILFSLAGIRSALKSMGRQAFVKVPVTCNEKPWRGRVERSLLLITLLATPDMSLEDFPEDLTAEDVNLDPSEPFCPLLVAVAYGRVDLAKRLISAGAEVNHVCARDENIPGSPIWMAEARKDQEMVSILKNAGANPYFLESWINAMQCCWTEGNEELLEIFMEEHRMSKDIFRYVVHRNFRGGSRSSVKLLLEDGNDPNETLDGGLTPFVAALSSQSPEIADCFLQCRKTKSDLVGADGRTSLMRMILPGGPSYHFSKSFVKHCISTQRFDLEIRDNSGETLLSHLIRVNESGVVEVLLEVGVNPNVPDVNGRTTLMKAVYYGKHRSTWTLLDHEPTNVNASDNWQWTALCYAVSNGKIACANMLFTSSRLDVEDSRHRLASVCFNSVEQGYGVFLRGFSDLRPQWFYREVVEQMQSRALRLGSTRVISALTDANLIP